MIRHANDLKHQIERLPDWEPAEHWQLPDFVFLSQRVMDYTNCWVEAADLQLFWQSSVTTPGLLDALAQFADHTDWNDWCTHNHVERLVPNREVPWLYNTRWEMPNAWVVWVLWLSGLLSVAVGALLLWKR